MQQHSQLTKFANQTLSLPGYHPWEGIVLSTEEQRKFYAMTGLEYRAKTSVKGLDEGVIPSLVFPSP